MAAGPTFEPIATTTLGSAASSITFSSIPSTYTDLRVIVTWNTNNATFNNLAITFNNDTATNYSDTYIYGNGASVGSARETSQAYINCGLSAGDSSTTKFAFNTLDVMSYAGSTYKTLLNTNSDDNNGSGYVITTVGLWRSSSAINRLDLKCLSTANFVAGTTATLYGVKSA